MALSAFLRTKSFITCLILVIGVTVACLFFPLTSKLGYEYSVVAAFLLSYISVFLSSEYLIRNDDNSNFYSAGIKYKKISYPFVLNAIPLTFAMLAGITGSVIGNDCWMSNGLKFFFLIPVISVFFSTALGSLCACVFGNRGFFAGSIILTLIICYSLFNLYFQPHLFMFNPVFGYFPGPVYDIVIPITDSFLIYRLNTVIWGILMIAVSGLLCRPGKGSLLSYIMVILAGSALITFVNFNSEDLGLGYSREYIRNNILGGHFQTENFNIYYKPGTRTEHEIELIAGDHEWRYSQLSNFLQVDPEKRIDSYIYPDTETRGRTTGAYRTTIANPVQGEMHLVYDTFPHDLLKHELVHVMSSEFGSRILKVSPKPGLIEGLAVAADWNHSGITDHQWSRELLESAKAPDLKDILGFGFWLRPSSVTYTLTGSFCRFLIDSFGIGKFKVFYRTGKTDVYDKGLDELIVLWTDFLKETPYREHITELSEYRFHSRGITQQKCPRKKEYYKIKGIEYYKSENYKIASDKFLKAYNLDRDDTETRIYLAHSLYFKGAYEKLAGLLKDQSGRGKIEDNVIRNLAANVIWKNEGYTNALEVFRNMKESVLTDALRRSIDIKIYLDNYNDDDLKSLYLSYLTSGNDFDRAAILSEIIHAYGSFSPAHYHMADIYFKRGDYIKASKHSKTAYITGLPGYNLKMRNLNLLGTSLYATGKLEKSIEVFEMAIKISHEMTGNSPPYAQDFIKRITWTKEKMNPNFPN